MSEPLTLCVSLRPATVSGKFFQATFIHYLILLGTTHSAWPWWELEMVNMSFTLTFNIIMPSPCAAPDWVLTSSTPKILSTESLQQAIFSLMINMRALCLYSWHNVRQVPRGCLTLQRSPISSNPSKIVMGRISRHSQRKESVKFGNLYLFADDDVL